MNIKQGPLVDTQHCCDCGAHQWGFSVDHEEMCKGIREEQGWQRCRFCFPVQKITKTGGIMKHYRASFYRLNFFTFPPLKQQADVFLATDIPFEDNSLPAFLDALWKAMWEQNPHWKDPRGPGGLGGWSSVLREGTEIEEMAVAEKAGK